MNKYELALVVSAKIDDAARTGVVDKAKDYITRFGGTIVNVEDWGKRKLAYEIQKEPEGFYYFIQFDSPSNVPAQLEQSVRIMDYVLRYLVVKRDDNAVIRKAPKNDEPAKKEEAVKPEEEPKAEEAPKAEEPKAEEAPKAETAENNEGKEE